ncbi:class I SAM-dependent methyltransferase [Rhodospirillum rubrum]|nr:hypothetical protein [Rhodospirillum rubrum]QXG79409.1 hypothetical protein KUL73_13625 [Rhodospirillum rubrum]
MSKVLLNIGCADVDKPGYINVDARKTKVTHLVSNAWDLDCFEENSVHEIYSRHMLEHLNPEYAKLALQKWFYILEPEGKLVVIVPDIEFHARQLLGVSRSSFGDQMEHAFAGFWGWREKERGGSDFDAHQWGYTVATLENEIGAVGFERIERVVEGVDSEPWHLQMTARKPMTSLCCPMDFRGPFP